MVAPVFPPHHFYIYSSPTYPRINMVSKVKAALPMENSSKGELSDRPKGTTP